MPFVILTNAYVYGVHKITMVRLTMVILCLQIFVLYQFSRFLYSERFGKGLLDQWEGTLYAVLPFPRFWGMMYVILCDIMYTTSIQAVQTCQQDMFGQCHAFILLKVRSRRDSCYRTSHCRSLGLCLIGSFHLMGFLAIPCATVVRTCMSCDHQRWSRLGSEWGGTPCLKQGDQCQRASEPPPIGI